MPIDGILLNRVVNNIKDELPLKINKITQPTKYDFTFDVYGKKRTKLHISCHPVLNRIHFSDLKRQPNLELTHFLSILRKYYDGAIIQNIEQIGFDRIVKMTLSFRDDMGVIVEHTIVLELMGRNANFVLINEDGKIIDAFKRSGNFESNTRATFPGGMYTYPDALNKFTIDNLSIEDKNISLREKYEGLSPILAKEISFRLETEAPETIIETLLTSDTLYVSEHDFHILPLTHLEKEIQSFPLMAGLDHYYRDIESESNIKSYTQDLLKVIRRELKRSKSKLPKLLDELDRAENSEHLKEAGDLLLSYHTEAPNGLKKVTLNNWDGSEITIPLNIKLNGIQNANDYYKRYKKAKTSLKYLHQQIEITQDRIDYFTSLLNQTEIASLEDAQEIREELIEAGLLKEKRKPSQKQKKQRPNYLLIEFDDKTTIFVGKNNLQNDALTFKIAKKEDLWFHAAQTFGAHVIMKTDEITEPKMELCAHLAAYYSNARDSANVEIFYTQVRNLKKIPGKQPGMVRISSQQSFFVNPNYAIIEPYLP